MKQSQYSTTAEGMAFVRAIEASRPPDKRICYDPIARALVNPISVFLSSYQVTNGRVRRVDVRVQLPVPLKSDYSRVNSSATVGTEPGGI
jgi:O-methyltransferase involved in polyketide biosynthesis